jgi:hypothetical protein
VFQTIRRATTLPALLGAFLFCTLSSTGWAQSATTTTLAVTAGGSAVTTVSSGTVVTLTATVKAGTAPVTSGEVDICNAQANFCEDINLLGTAQLTGAGTATLKFRPGVGTHSYRTVFVGTTGNAPSTSGTESLAVTGKPLTSATVAANSVQLLAVSSGRQQWQDGALRDGLVPRHE